MYDYVTRELPELIETHFPVSTKRAISGHSMGGHGALIAALREPGRYRSVSAFSPISHPSRCPWGQKALGAYLGNNPCCGRSGMPASCCATTTARPCRPWWTWGWTTPPGGAARHRHPGRSGRHPGVAPDAQPPCRLRPQLLLRGELHRGAPALSRQPPGRTGLRLTRSWPPPRQRAAIHPETGDKDASLHHIAGHAGPVRAAAGTGPHRPSGLGTRQLGRDPSERFSARGHLCHLLDIEVLGYQVRFRRTLAESLPELASLDGYQLALDHDYPRRIPPRSSTAFVPARLQTVEWLKTVPSDAWQRRARYGGYGEVTLDGLVRLLVSHDHQHLAGMQWLLMRLNADLGLALPSSEVSSHDVASCKKGPEGPFSLLR